VKKFILSIFIILWTINTNAQFHIEYEYDDIFGVYDADIAADAEENVSALVSYKFTYRLVKYTPFGAHVWTKDIDVDGMPVNGTHKGKIVIEDETLYIVTQLDSNKMLLFRSDLGLENTESVELTTPDFAFLDNIQSSDGGILVATDAFIMQVSLDLEVQVVIGIDYSFSSVTPPAQYIGAAGEDFFMAAEVYTTTVFGNTSAIQLSRFSGDMQVQWSEIIYSLHDHNVIHLKDMLVKNGRIYLVLQNSSHKSIIIALNDEGKVQWSRRNDVFSEFRSVNLFADDEHIYVTGWANGFCMRTFKNDGSYIAVTAPDYTDLSEYGWKMLPLHHTMISVSAGGSSLFSHFNVFSTNEAVKFCDYDINTSLDMDSDSILNFASALTTFLQSVTTGIPTVTISEKYPSYTNGCRTNTFANFEYSVEPGLQVSFENTSRGANHFTWSFGDGEQSSEDFPVHVYADTGTYHVCLKAESSCDMFENCDDITVTSVVGVPEHRTRNVTVYPTIAASELYIRNVRNTNTVKVFDMTGRAFPVTVDRVGSGLLRIHTDALASGAYLLKVDKGTYKFFVP